MSKIFAYQYRDDFGLITDLAPASKIPADVKKVSLKKAKEILGVDEFNKRYRTAQALVALGA